jgi:hypothetical protein
MPNGLVVSSLIGALSSAMRQNRPLCCFLFSAAMIAAHHTVARHPVQRHRAENICGSKSVPALGTELRASLFAVLRRGARPPMMDGTWSQHR